MKTIAIENGALAETARPFAAELARGARFFATLRCAKRVTLSGGWIAGAPRGPTSRGAAARRVNRPFQSTRLAQLGSIRCESFWALGQPRSIRFESFWAVAQLGSIRFESFWALAQPGSIRFESFGHSFSPDRFVSNRFGHSVSLNRFVLNRFGQSLSPDRFVLNRFGHSLSLFRSSRSTCALRQHTLVTSHSVAECGTRPKIASVFLGAAPLLLQRLQESIADPGTALLRPIGYGPLHGN